MVANARKKWTVEEYLAFERTSEEKHEYFDGDVFPVGQPPSSTRGTGRRHSLLLTNTITSLNHQLRDRSCELYTLDMGIRVSGVVDVSADVSIVCDEPQFVDDTCNMLLNPTIIVEVLSDSTEDYDRGKKFEHYRTLESLQEYVLISQNEIHVEHYRRTSGNWIFSEAKTLDETIELPSIGCTVNLADIYRKITFDVDDTATDA